MAGSGTLVGSILYEVAVDTRQLIEAERTTDKSAAKMATSLTQVAEASKMQAAAAGLATSAVREATRVNDGAAASANKAAEGARNAAKATEQQAMSAKALAAATRNIPAQATDIFTGLAAGQSPLTVLLQQGGQLKDMFGGVGPAARAFGGYIAGLVTPFTAAAAAVGVYVYGLVKGKEEMADFNRNLILTGNQSGVTANQLNALAAELGKTSGIARNEAAEGLNVLVQAGIAGERNLGRFTEAAIRLEKAGGPSIAKTADAFRDLGREPVKASEKLNESVNFLTKDLYLQIRALEEQGKKTEAATLAQNAFADAIMQRTPQVMENLGYIERGWNAVKAAVSSAVSAVTDIGRVPTLKEMQEQLAKAEQNLVLYGGRRREREEQAIVALRQQIAAQADLEDKAQVSAQTSADQAKGTRAAAQWADQGAQFLDKQAKMQRDINTARELGVTLGLKDSDIQKRIAQIKDSYAEKKQPVDQDKYLADLRAKVAPDLNRVDIIEEQAIKEARAKLTSESAFQEAKTLIERRANDERLAILIKDGADRAQATEEVRKHEREEAKRADDADKKAADERKRGQALANGIIGDADPITKLQMELAQKSELLLQAYMLDQENEELYATARVALENETSAKIKAIRDKENEDRQQAQIAQLQGYAQLFDGLAGLTQAFAGKQSSAYRAMFAVSKAFSVASSILSITTGMARAQELGFPANIVEMARVAATGATLLTTIRGTNYGGGRQYGGPTSAGSLYRVNETGRPEMYTASNGNQYMLGTSSGRVTSADDVGGGRKSEVHIHNYSGAQVRQEQSDDGNRVDVFIGEVARQIRDNDGPVWGAMRSSTNVQSRL